MAKKPKKPKGLSHSEYLLYCKVIKAFETPTQLKIRSLQYEKHLLERASATIQTRITKLSRLVDKEQDQIADKLDKQIPNWRILIVKAVANE